MRRFEVDGYGRMPVSQEYTQRAHVVVRACTPNAARRRAQRWADRMLLGALDWRERRL